MLTARGFSAWITSGGKELQEFDIVVDEYSHKISCWIGCEVGSSFIVHWRDNGTGIDSAGYIVLDGFTCSGRFLYGYGDASRGTLRVDQHSERPFVFASPESVRSVSLRSDQSSLNGPAAINRKEAGTIVLKIRQIKRTAPTHPPNTPQIPPNPIRRTARHTHEELCVSFGKKTATSLQHPQTWSFEPYDKANPHAFITFMFRYRTRDFLLSQGIITDEEALTAAPPPPLYTIAQEDEESEHDPGSPLSNPQQHTPVSSPQSLPSNSVASSSTLAETPASTLSSHSSYSSPATNTTQLDGGCSTSFFPLQSPTGLKRTAEHETMSLHHVGYYPLATHKALSNKRSRTDRLS